MKRLITALATTALLTTGIAAPANAQPNDTAQLSSNLSSIAQTYLSDILGVLVKMGILPESAWRAAYGDICYDEGATALDFFGKELECRVAGEAGLTWMAS